MDDLISRKWIVECLEEGWIKLDTEVDYNKMIHLVRDTAPSAQPEIIRCKECVYADENYHCDYMTTWNDGDCFCCYGKRRTDGSD